MGEERRRTSSRRRAFNARVDACRCEVRDIASRPGRVCACGITWRQRPNDPGGPGGWYAPGPKGLDDE